MSKNITKDNIDDHDACGFIYPAFDFVMSFCKYINLVELFKFIARIIKPKNADLKISLKYSRISVDIFIICKWIYLLLLILLKAKGAFTTIILWYLQFTNIFTYFFYHVWDERTLLDNHITATRVKRRFLNLLVSILFTIVGFAYFYYSPYNTEYSWTVDQPTFFHSMVFSVSNSLTAGYNIVGSMSTLGFLIATIQLMMMFFFLTIIIVGSIPQINSVTKGN